MSYKLITGTGNKVLGIKSVLCGHTIFAGVQTEDAYRKIFAGHMEQHSEGRAVDIEVEYQVVAYCSVCKNGVGTVDVVDSESLECADCHTTWDIDGTNGETE